MSSVDWVWCNKRSSFLQKVIEFTIFSSGTGISGLVGNSWDFDINFGKFLKWQFFSWTKSVLFRLSLFTFYETKNTGVQLRKQWRWYLILFRRYQLIRWFVWCNYFWVRKWRVVLGEYCMREVRNLCRVDQPFFFPKMR